MTKIHDLITLLQNLEQKHGNIDTLITIVHDDCYYISEGAPLVEFGQDKIDGDWINIKFTGCQEKP